MKQHTETTSCKCGECTAKVNESIEFLEELILDWEDKFKNTKSDSIYTAMVIGACKNTINKYQQAIDLLRTLE